MIGKVSHEILGNGGINWNKDFQRMLQTLPAYLKLGHALPEPDLQVCERLVKELSSGNGDKQCDELTDYTVAWVLQNWDVLPVIPPVYKR